MTTYDIGDAPTVTASFRNLNGELTDPTLVTVEYTLPDGTVIALDDIANPSVGVYRVTVPALTLSGEYVVKFFGTGALIAAEEIRFTAGMRPSEATAEHGPCGLWPYIESCPRPEHLAKVGDRDPQQWVDMIQTATQILWAASGRRFGTCRTVERPLGQVCGCIAVGPCIRCNDPLAGVQYVRLARRPVTRLHAVTIDGVTLPIDSFAIADNRYLLRLDGDAWPHDNDLTIALDAPDPTGTWAIDYSYGKRVPHLGQMAVAELAVELGKACQGDNTCKLPKRIQNVTRQGMSMTLIDPQEYLDKGRWGLTLVDQFIASTNPNRLRRSARVFRADPPRSARPLPMRLVREVAPEL